MALLSVDSCSNSKFRTYNSRKSTLDIICVNTGVFQKDLHDVLSKWWQALQQEDPQATKPYVHLRINQFNLQVQKEEEEEEEEEEEREQAEMKEKET